MSSHVSHRLNLLGLALAACALLLASCASPRCLASEVDTASAPACADAPMGHAHPEALERDVALLKSPDFEARNLAAQRLVAAGERALPVLGAAGEGRVAVPGASGVSTTRPVVRSILEDLTQERLNAHLGAAWPVVRGEAAEQLGQRGMWNAVPRLIESMEDPDVGVRASAASSLRRLTNRFFGYDARAHTHARREAATRWREWWAIEGRVRSEDDGMDAR